MKAVQRTMHNIRNNIQVMVKVMVLFCGESRQILTVIITEDIRTNEVNVSLK